MLKSYTAIYKHGYLDWLNDVPPQQENVQVIVTFIESSTPKKSLTQAQNILHQAWGCIEIPCTIAQIDADIAQMRSEWE